MSPNGGFIVTIPPTIVSKVALTPRQDWNGRIVGSRINLVKADGSVAASAIVKDSDLTNYPITLLNENGKQVQWYMIDMTA